LVTRSSHPIEGYLEIGKKRTFAGAIEWPGWCRSGRDEPSALESLVQYGPRYASVLAPAGIAFRVPDNVSGLAVIERLEGDTTTDFGAPGIAPSADARAIDEAQFERFEALLKACWRAFDETVRQAAGKELRKGPRGGGRNTEAIIQHVLGAEAGYLSAVGWKHRQDDSASLTEQLAQTRQAILSALAAATRGEIPERGPRGGLRWTPRYFVRRVAWHVLDHAWEIEDRLLP
jgi:hypothetical protein